MLTLKGLNDKELTIDDRFGNDESIEFEISRLDEVIGRIYLKKPEVIELYEHLSKVINNSK